MSERMKVFFYLFARTIVRFLRAQRKRAYRQIVCPVAGRMPGVGVFLRNKMLYRWLQDDAVALIARTAFTGDKEMEKLLSSLSTKDLLSAQSVFSVLGKLQKEKIRNSLDSRKKTVALYFASGAYRENTGTIAKGLREKGYNVFILIGEVCDDKYEQGEYVYYGGNDIINELDFIDVLIEISGIAEKLIHTKKIYFPHDIYDSPLGNVVNREGIAKHMAECDYLFLSSHYVLDRCEQMIFFVRRKFPRALVVKPQVCLIPGGYIKLDKNLEYFEHHKQDTTALIYAPTVMKERMGGMGSVASLAHGDKVIEALLGHFQNYDVIFRPHPHSLDTVVVKKIVEKYSSYPRFLFDDNQSSYMENYAKSALMVTDMSGTAYTYAFTTLRPVVFFSHDENKAQKRFGEFAYFKDREKIGRVAQSIEELIQYTEALLATKNEWSMRIKRHRDPLIYNIGKAEDYFVENFEYIAEAKKHPDWVYI